MIKDPSKDHYQRARQALRISLIEHGRSLIRCIEELPLYTVTIRSNVSYWLGQKQNISIKKDASEDIKLSSPG
nr:hypothetical protein [Tanacetum cinerariifolium]